jgi:hypothetical protein
VRRCRQRSPAFSCQRFWVPRTGGMIDLSDGGFLRDPTGLFARSDAAGARQLRELAGYRALALLGEPGIGKSTTLPEEAARVGEQAGAGTVSIHADLRAYSSESLLYRRIFESDEFLAWETGHSHLVLHLDSLDEALLRIDSIANLLTDELPRCPVERLSVRIACRTAVWPAATLETALCGIWGEAAVGVFELQDQSSNRFLVARRMLSEDRSRRGPARVLRPKTQVLRAPVHHAAVA